MGGQILEAALEYADGGHRVFIIWSVRADGSCECPKGASCSSPGKHPHGFLCPNGLHDATDDEETIRAWWRQYPQGNVGLVMGEGLFAIDCDKSGGNDGTVTFLALMDRWGGMPETAAADTGGGGCHFLFATNDAVPVRNQQGMLVDGERIRGIDVRGVGGYIVAPPSVHASGNRYQWARPLWDVKAAPAELLNQLAKAGAPPEIPHPMTAYGVDPTDQSQQRTVPPPTAPVVARAVDPAVVEQIRAVLRCIPPNVDRETWVERVGMPLHDYFGGSDEGFALWHGWSAEAQGMTTPSGKPAYGGEHECRRIWRSFHTTHRNPKGIATLFELGQTYGYVSQPVAVAPPAADNGQHVWPEPSTPGLTIFSDEEIADTFAHVPRDPGAFPASIAASLEGPLRDLLEWMVAAARRPDRTIALAASVAVMAGALGRRVLGPNGSRPTLTLAMLAPSGSGKDKPQACIKNLVESHPNLALGLLDDTPTHRTQLDDLLLKKRGQVLMVLDEYGATLQRWLKQTDHASGSMSPTIRKLALHDLTVYHLAPVSLRHPSRAANVDAWDAGIFGPAFSMVGFATPGQFYESLSDSSLTDGFLGRHVVIESSSTENLRSPLASTLDIPATVQEWLSSVEALPVPRVAPPSTFQGLQPPGAPGASSGASATPPMPDLAPSDPRDVPWASETVDDAWEALCASIDRAGHRAIADGDETLAAILRRLPGQTATLALVLACGEAPTIGEAAVAERHIDLAYKVARWSADNLAYRLRRGVASDDVGRALLHVCECIERRAPRKVYRSYFSERAKVAPWLARVWPLVQSNPRFEASEKWAKVRDPSVSTPNTFSQPVEKAASGGGA